MSVHSVWKFRALAPSVVRVRAAWCDHRLSGLNSKHSRAWKGGTGAFREEEGKASKIIDAPHHFPQAPHVPGLCLFIATKSVGPAVQQPNDILRIPS